MTTAVIERDVIAELAETDEIRRSRILSKRLNEMVYTDGDILSFASALSGICGLNVYVGKEVVRYFEILDSRDFLLDKFSELSDIDAAKYKDEIEEYLQEANEELEFLKSQILKK